MGTEQNFIVGDWVKIAPLGISAQIIEIRGDGKLVVMSKGSLKTVVSVNSATRINTPAASPTRPIPTESKHLEREIDLHGLTTEKAIATLEKVISDSLPFGLSRMEIIHGLGSGKVQKAVHRYLSNSSHVANFAISDSNPGVTVAWF